jgi:YHS domain-containing protein
MKFLTTTLVILTLATGSALAQQANDQAASQTPQADAREQQRIGDPWPLSTCPVSGEVLGEMGQPIVKIYDGREVRFCCNGCIDTFEANPEQYLTKADEKIIEQQKQRYPLETCIVSGQPLDSMNGPVTRVIGNRAMMFCCAACVPKAEEKPAAYIEILDRVVIEKQAKDYPLETCVISGQPLDSMGGPVNMVVANQLVQLCCTACEKKVEADPAGTLAKIDEARQAKAKSSEN